MVPLARDDDDGDDDEGERWQRLEDDRSQIETDN